MATGHDIAMGLRAAYLLMHRQTNAFLAAFGMTADQFVLLALLADEDGITQQELAERARSDPNTIRAMLVLIEKNGIVRRGKHPSDRRARRVTLTRKGRGAYAKVSAEIRPLQDALLRPFGTIGARKLLMSLDRISDGMMKWERQHQTGKTKQAMKGED